MSSALLVSTSKKDFWFRQGFSRDTGKWKGLREALSILSLLGVLVVQEKRRWKAFLCRVRDKDHLVGGRCGTKKERGRQGTEKEAKERPKWRYFAVRPVKTELGSRLGFFSLCSHAEDRETEKHRF